MIQLGMLAYYISTMEEGAYNEWKWRKFSWTRPENYDKMKEEEKLKREYLAILEGDNNSSTEKENKEIPE